MNSGDVGIGDAECAERGNMRRTMPERAHNTDPANRHRQNFREEASKLGAVVIRHDNIGPVIEVRRLRARLDGICMSPVGVCHRCRIRLDEHCPVAQIPSEMEQVTGDR